MTRHNNYKVGRPGDKFYGHPPGFRKLLKAIFGKKKEASLLGQQMLRASQIIRVTVRWGEPGLKGDRKEGRKEET